MKWKHLSKVREHQNLIVKAKGGREAASSPLLSPVSLPTGLSTLAIQLLDARSLSLFVPPKSITASTSQTFHQT